MWFTIMTFNSFLVTGHNIRIIFKMYNHLNPILINNIKISIQGLKILIKFIIKIIANLLTINNFYNNKPDLNKTFNIINNKMFNLLNHKIFNSFNPKMTIETFNHNKYTLSKIILETI